MNITNIFGIPLRVKVRVLRKVNGVQTKTRLFTDQNRLDDYLSAADPGAEYTVTVCAQSKAHKPAGILWSVEFEGKQIAVRSSEL